MTPAASVIKTHEYVDAGPRANNVCARCLGRKDLPAHNIRPAGRSFDPFQIDGKTFADGERVEILRADGELDRGTFAGTQAIGLGTGIIVDIDGVEVVYLAPEIKAIRHLPAPGAVDWGFPSDDPEADAAAMAVWTR
jgi:hypothetical protein